MIARIVLPLALALLPILSVAQFVGPTSVSSGSTVNYSYNDGTLYTKPNWQVQGGTLLSSTSSGTLYSCTVQFPVSCTTTAQIQFRQGSTERGTLSVNVLATPPPAPAASFSVSNACGSSTIQRSAAPAGELWYWQTRADGTEVTDSGLTFTVSVSKIYYLRAFACGLWSEAQATPNIVVNNPAAPTITSQPSRCGTGVVTLTASAGAGGDLVRWFDQPSGGTLLGSGNSYSPTLSSIGNFNFYAESFSSAAGCAGTNRTLATVAALQPPVVPVISGAATIAVCESATQFLLTSDATTGIQWHKNGSALAGQTSANLLLSGALSSAGVYRVSQTVNGCTSFSAEKTVTMNPLPSATTTLAPGGTLCGPGPVSVRLAQAQAGVNYQVFNAGNSAISALVPGIAGTLTITTATISASGEIFVMATTATSGCQRQIGPTTVTVNPVPAAPVISPAGSIQRCEDGGTITLTAGSFTGSLQWYKNGVVIGGQTGSILSLPHTLSSTGTYTVTQWVGGCESAHAEAASVAVGSLPAATPLISPATATVCGPTAVTFSLNSSQTGITYRLVAGATNLSDAVAGTGAGIQIVSYPLLSSTSVDVRATNTSTGCTVLLTNSASVTYAPIPVKPTIAQGANLTKCQEAASTQITSSAATGNQWYKDGVAIAGATGQEFFFSTVPGNGGIYRVAQTSSGCTSPLSDPLQVTINATPSATLPVTPAIAEVCSGGTLALTIGNAQPGVQYQVFNGATPLSTVLNGAGSDLVLTTSALASTQILQVRATQIAGGCQTLLAGTATATIKPVPTITNPEGAMNYTACADYNLTFTPVLSVTGATYSWTSTATSGISGHNPSGTTAIADKLTSVGTTAGTVTYSITPALNGCQGPTRNLVVNLFPKPPIAGSGPGVLVYGSGPGSGLTLSAPAAFTSYQWSLNGQDISGATQRTYLVTTGGLFTLRVKLSETAPACANTYEVNSSLTGQKTSVNLVSSTRILKEGVGTNTSLFQLEAKDLAQTISYQDGLGRTFQTVGVGQSPTQTDVIYPMAYGPNSLVDSTFLPYVSTRKDGRFRLYAIRDSVSKRYTQSEQYQFYQTTPLIARDTRPFARTLYRAAPDARITEQGAPGADWQPGTGHTLRKRFLTNTAATPVRFWKTDGSTNSFYPANSLLIEETTDENGNLVRKFIDSRGLPVLKQVQLDEPVNGQQVPWLETVYIYDNFGQLLYQVPPEALRKILVESPIDADNAPELIFKYTYDDRGRLVQKKVPGAAVEFFVYDKLNRLVLSQDGNLRTNQRWVFIKYDVYNRPVYTGIYTNTVQTTLTAVQGLLNALNYATEPRFEVEQVNATYHGYSNLAFPTAGTQVLAVNYYDHYNFDRSTDASPDFSFDAAHLTGLAPASAVARNQATGSKKVIINSTGAITTNWLTSVVFYDQYERPIQVQSNSHLYLTVRDKVSIVYDFVRPVKSRSSHFQNATSAVHFTDRSEFDAAGRVVRVFRQIDGMAEQLLAAYTYNALGQVVDKKLHGTGTSFLQSVDYRYNIRGWLTSINNGQLTNDKGATNDDADDFFGMNLFYNQAANGLGNRQQYNGNISAAIWKGAGMETPTEQTNGARAYRYDYDKSDRLKKAEFRAADSTGAWTKQLDAYNETLSYDRNGNILSLQRTTNNRTLDVTVVKGAAQVIDQLTYTYTANTNRLVRVDDAVTAEGGFTNRASTATEYSYTGFGSASSDLNKGISSITYNLLGKPLRVTLLPDAVSGTPARTVEYTYDATGAKLSMRTTVGTQVTTTDYTKGFLYLNGAVSFFSSPEGRVVRKGAAFEFEYAIADHQGNTRVLFSATPPPPDVFTATYENPAADATVFSRVPNASPHWGVSVPANNTPGGNKTIRLNNAFAVASAKSLRVYAGDKVDAEVWVYHESTAGFGTVNTPLLTLVNLVSQAFGGVINGPGESGRIYSGVSSAINGFGGGGNRGDNDPAAYLNYILFDANYKVLNMGWKQVPGAARFSRQRISLDPVSVSEAGFLFVYLSYENQSSNLVFFDDMKITHTKSRLVQYNEYYAYGLPTAASWTRDVATGNPFLGNGGTEWNTTLGLYDLEYREYDPALGRMHAVDPMAPKYASLSTYHYAFNDPVSFTDVNGADPLYETIHYYNQAAAGVGSTANVRIMDTGTFGGGHIFPGSGGHWTDRVWGQLGAVGMGRNISVMSQRNFEAFYGLNMSNSADRFNVAKYLASGQNYEVKGVKKGTVSSVSTTSFYNKKGLLGGIIHYGAGWKPTSFEVRKLVLSRTGSGYIGDGDATVVDVEAGEMFDFDFAISQMQVQSQTNLGENSANTANSNLFYGAFGGVTSVTGFGVEVTKSDIKSGAVYATEAGKKGVKLLGRGVTGLSLAASTAQLIFNDNRKPSDYARFAGSVLIAGLSAIPVAGPGISFGLGIADAAGAFEGFYQSWDIPGMPVVYLNIAMRALPR